VSTPPSLRTFLLGGQGALGLKLQEGPLDDGLGLDSLEAQHVEDHIVGEMEGRVQRIGDALSA